MLFDPEVRARQLDHIIEQVTQVHVAQGSIPTEFFKSLAGKEKHYLVHFHFICTFERLFLLTILNIFVDISRHGDRGKYS